MNAESVRMPIILGAALCLLAGCPKASGGPGPESSEIVRRGELPAAAAGFQKTGLPNERLEFDSLTNEFPPRPKGFSESTLVPWKEIPSALTEERAREILDAALADRSVRKLLGERFAHIDTGEVGPKKGQERKPSDPLVTQITFYSYANNVTVEVEMADTKVRSAIAVEAYQPPAAPEEVEVAVALVRDDPRIGTKVAGLSARGILTPGIPGRPGQGHRILYVTFRPPRSNTPAYWASVDLTDQKVLAAGPAGPRRSKE